MTVAAAVLSDVQRSTLEAVCETIVPSVSSDGDPVMRDFLIRGASELGVAAQIEGLMGQAMPPEQIEGFAQLLDGLAQYDFASLPVEARTEILHQVAGSSHEARLGVISLRNLTLLFFYGLPDEVGRNPNWEAIGYPGPLSPPPSEEQAPKTISVLLPGTEQTLTADVCVVGSGAGGAVIAAELQQAGRSVLVLEMGGYRNEADFKQLELPGLFELYLGGGLLASEDGSITIFAGSTLGGGTIVNYMNCLRTPQRIRREWSQHGLEGVGEETYEEHIDAVMRRISATDEATTQNRQHKKLIGALESSGIEHRPIVRNVDRSCEDPRVCGYCSSGCQKGCKQSTMKTYLQDASDAGARVVVGAHADRIVLGEDGSASGVEATVSAADGSATKLTVQAQTVVVACGSIESPALLLRSGIGGPAAGKHLRLHPAAIVNGIYEEPIEAWIGQIQSEVSDHVADCEGEWGFLIESVGATPAVYAGAFPWRDGEQHKRELARTFPRHAPFISVARDHGEGEVVLDPHGQPVVRWSLDDEVDRRLFVRANVELARLHHAAGAPEIRTLHAQELAWRRDSGEPFEQFLGRIEQAPYGPADVTIFTAHQMGSCRMGSDPSDSVADGCGELHDTKGVWIGDASAFPTAPGVNPMVSIMALARRTAKEILSG